MKLEGQSVMGWPFLLLVVAGLLFTNANISKSPRCTYCPAVLLPYSRWKEALKENLKTNIGEGQRLSIVDKGKEHNTRQVIADKLGWSTGKLISLGLITFAD